MVHRRSPLLPGGAGHVGPCGFRTTGSARGPLPARRLPQVRLVERRNRLRRTLRGFFHSGLLSIAGAEFHLQGINSTPVVTAVCEDGIAPVEPGVLAMPLWRYAIARKHFEPVSLELSKDTVRPSHCAHASAAQQPLDPATVE